MSFIALGGWLATRYRNKFRIIVRNCFTTKRHFRADLQGGPQMRRQRTVGSGNVVAPMPLSFGAAIKLFLGTQTVSMPWSLVVQISTLIYPITS